MSLAVLPIFFFQSIEINIFFFFWKCDCKEENSKEPSYLKGTNCKIVASHICMEKEKKKLVKSLSKVL